MCVSVTLCGLFVADCDSSEQRTLQQKHKETNNCNQAGDRWVKDLQPIGTDWIKEYLTDAPWLVLVFKQIHGYLADGRKKIHYYNEISVSIATGILLTAIQVFLFLLRRQMSPINFREGFEPLHWVTIFLIYRKRTNKTQSETQS